MSTRWLGLLLFVFWIGGSGTAHGAPALTVTPDSPPTVNFGSVRVANATTTTASMSFNLRNSGSSGNLNISAVSFGASTEYTVTPSPPYNGIAPGDSVNVNVVFDPSTAGPRPATMSIASNDPAGPKTVSLTGTGTTAIISVPSTIDFGLVLDGVASSQNLTISNTATTSPGPLTVRTATITGSAFFSFGTMAGCTATSCTFNPPLVITTTSSSTVPVICQPPAAASGAPTATVTFVDNDADSGSSTTTLSCTAGRPNISVSVSALTFTGLAVGQSQTKTVTITNNGNTPLTYSLAEVPDVGQYTFTAGCTSACTIQPPPATNTATFDVKFIPTSPVQVTTRIDITNNDPDPGDNVKSINVSGTGDQGVVATVPASPTALDFGAIPQGSTKMLPFTLKNSGNVAVTGITAQLGNAGLGFQIVGTVPDTLPASQEVNLNVQFAPPAGNAGGSTSITFRGNWSADGLSDTTMAVLDLTGVGQTTGYDVSPATRAFGDFRFDSRPTLTYAIKNTAQADVTVLAAADFTPDPPTTSGEFAFAVTKNGAPIALTPPPILHEGEQLDVAVTAQPSNRTGALSGHVTIRTSLSPDRQVTLTGNAISAAFTVPNTVDFGAVDIDGGPQVQTFNLRNTGTAPLDIMSIAKRAGGSAAFAVTPLPTTRTPVAPQTDFMLTVTYTPTTTRPMNQPETLVLDATLAGVAGSPGNAAITISGRGIDRVLALDAAPVFPATFRNPGDAAPVKAVTVHNDGEALLKVTAVMISDGAATAGSPVWQLVDSSPADIPGGGSHDFLVKFVPKEIDDANHKTPPGRLVLINNDNARSMATVDLTGTCVARRVAFERAEIDLGQIGVGIPTDVTLPAVRNMEGVAFTIHSIELGDQMAFRLDSELRDVALPASSTQSLVVTLDPAAAGPLSTVVKLYVDQDPTPQTELTVTATAVFVDAHGGGGCAVAGRNAGGGPAIALGALTVFGLLGRRRRRAVRRAIAAASLGAMIAVVARAAPARAEDIGITVFEPTPATTGSGFQLQSPDVGTDGSWAASSVVSYASNPLVLSGLGPAGPYHAVPVERSTLLELGLAYALLDRFEIGAHLPLYMQSGQVDANAQSSVRGVEAASGTALGKLKVHAKARLWRGGGGLGELVAGASAIAVIPTATSRQYTGSDKPEGRLLVLGSFTPAALGSRLSFSLNGGAIVRSEVIYASIAQRSGIAWGLGGSYRVLDSLWATAELFGEATPSGRRESASGTAMPTATLVQAEWLAGVSWRADRRFTVGLAAGRGMTDALGTPDLRGVLSIAFTQGAPAVAPIRSAERLRPDIDSDGDGIPDSLDKCPNEPEDKDMFDDDDGCPDPDNDHDGIPDALDKCPIDPEDKDGFQDEDGCPDKDNDGDGIPDAQDRCPNEPEDKDGFEDLDGCPDPDNDHDGIPDAQDKCPNEPETINGIKDDDGCPDKGDSTIVLSPDRIETLDPIPFTGLKIARAALPLLGQVAATLRAHTEIVRVRVTVHVQPSGDADADQVRAEKRAQAVRDWLVQWGIAPGRLDARGFGSAKPLVPANQRGAAKINDRIEFIILERR